MQLKGLELYAVYNAAIQHNFAIQTDKSRPWGCGVLLQRRWFQWEWLVQWAPLNIMVKELVPIFISCSVCSSQLAKHSVLFECDNSSVAAVLSNGIAEDNAIMYLLRVLWFCIAYYDTELIPKHNIPGMSNCMADYLSRHNMQRFFN